jgi:hypothetical protein
VIVNLHGPFVFFFFLSSVTLNRRQLYKFASVQLLKARVYVIIYACNRRGKTSYSRLIIWTIYLYKSKLINLEATLLARILKWFSSEIQRKQPNRAHKTFVLTPYTSMYLSLESTGNILHTLQSNSYSSLVYANCKLSRVKLTVYFSSIYASLERLLWAENAFAFGKVPKIRAIRQNNT